MLTFICLTLPFVSRWVTDHLYESLRVCKQVMTRTLLPARESSSAQQPSIFKIRMQRRFYGKSNIGSTSRETYSSPQEPGRFASGAYAHLSTLASACSDTRFSTSGFILSEM